MRRPGRPRPRTTSPRRCRARSRTAGGRTGRRPAARRRSGSTGGSRPHPWWTPCRGPDVHVWWGDDRYVPRDHPLSNVKAFDDILLGIGLGEEGVGRRGSARRPDPDRAGPSVPDDRVDRPGAAVRPGARPTWPTNCAAPVSPSPMAGRSSTSCSSASAATVTCCRSSRGRRRSTRRSWRSAIPAPTHIEPHVERVTLNPAVAGRRPGRPGRRDRRRQGGGHRRRSRRGRRGPAGAAGAARPACRCDVDPRRGGRRRAVTLTTPSRFVASRDGTPIAVFSSGVGPPLVVVHGATADHTTFRVVGPMLATSVHRPRHRPARAWGVR